MNVSELIEELNQVKDKSKEIIFFIDVDWEEVGMNEVLELDDRILLGDDLPPEKHEKDYKYEREI